MKKYIKNKILIASILGIGLTVGAIALWQMGFFEKQKPVKVAWVIEKPLEFAPTDQNQLALESNKKPSKNRSPAAVDPSAMGPRFQAGTNKLVIKLHFLCSSWTYLRGSKGDPNLVNDSLCKQFAAEQTQAANRIFDKSKIPLYFTYDYSFDRPAYKNMNGTFGTRAAIQARISDNLDPATFLTAVNNNSRLTNPHIMPAIDITDLESLLVHNPARLYVSNERVILPTGLPGFNPVTCTNPNSTSTINNYQYRWGIPNGSIESKCNTAAALGCRIFEKEGSVPSPSGLGSVYGCVPSCHCVQIYGNPTLWNSMCPSFGAWPGTAGASSGYNNCGYKIRTSVEYWTNDLDTIYPTERHYHIIEDFYTLDWLEKSRSSNANYMPVYNEYKIIVAAKPFVAWALGMAPTVDVTTGWAAGLFLSGGARQGLIKSKEEFFQKYGAVVLSMNTPFTGVLAHELGHLFGAFHEILSLSNPAFGIPQFSHDYLKSRKLGAFIQPLTQTTDHYKTIMGSTMTEYTKDFFSSRSVKDGKNPLGINEDNRAQIVNTVSFLAGRNMETVKTPEQNASIINTIISIIFGDTNK